MKFGDDHLFEVSIMKQHNFRKHQMNNLFVDFEHFSQYPKARSMFKVNSKNTRAYLFLTMDDVFTDWSKSLCFLLWEQSFRVWIRVLYFFHKDLNWYGNDMIEEVGIWRIFFTGWPQKEKMIFSRMWPTMEDTMTHLEKDQ